VLARLIKAPEKVATAHPRLGTGTSFVLSHDKFIGTLTTQLYGTTTRSLVPLVIHQTFLKNYQPLIGLIATTEGVQPMYVGLTMNIVCNEDMPKVSTQMFIDDANNDFGGNTSHKAWQGACPLWPKYSVNKEFYQPVTANIPTLILSGDLDPVTPPSNGDESAATLPNSHHIISKNNAHIVATTDCAIDILSEFLETLDPKNLDESCLTDIPDETFMTSLNGSI
jgi:pimeloyl-ACP methyl ester carboxylesterase